VIRAIGEIMYFKNGYLHRYNKPARICVDGTKEYWENGKRLQN
jgi:hypothetical protein